LGFSFPGEKGRSGFWLGCSRQFPKEGKCQGIIFSFFFFFFFFFVVSAPNYKRSCIMRNTVFLYLLRLALELVLVLSELKMSFQVEKKETKGCNTLQVKNLC